MKKRSAKCEEIRRQLDPFVDKELSAEEVENLCSYLEQCQEIRECHECRQAIDGIRRLKALVAASDRVRLPADLLETVRRRLDDDDDGEETGDADE